MISTLSAWNLSQKVCPFPAHDFRDTRPFCVNKWKIIVGHPDLISIYRTRLWRQFASSEHYEAFVNEQLAKTTSSKQRFRLQSLQLVQRPVQAFISSFVRQVQPERVDMSLIWGLIYLNVMVRLKTLDFLYLRLMLVTLS